MLVLTRRTSETIRIGDNIVIRVNRVGRQQVSLGIEAATGRIGAAGRIEADAGRSDGESAGGSQPRPAGS